MKMLKLLKEYLNKHFIMPTLFLLIILVFNIVSQLTLDKLYKIGWGRGGRTDKGVHAVCNVINVKLCIHKDYTLNNYEELVEEAKKNL